MPHLKWMLALGYAYLFGAGWFSVEWAKDWLRDPKDMPPWWGVLLFLVLWPLALLAYVVLEGRERWHRVKNREAAEAAFLLGGSEAREAMPGRKVWDKEGNK